MFSSFRAETNHVSLLPTTITCHISSGTKPGNVSRLSTSMT
jgi:hypothetical protein